VFGRRDPDARGYYGGYGGRFVPETLVAPIEELAAVYLAARADVAAQRRCGGEGVVWGADFPQAGGPDSHRRTQDQ
jgi:hypothetical protein